MSSEEKSGERIRQPRSPFLAIQNRQHNEVRALVAVDAGLLQAYDDSSFGATPLTLAVFRDDRETVDVLIELGVDLDRASNW